MYLQAESPHLDKGKMMVYKHAKVPFLQKKCTHSHRPQLIADFLSFIILYFTLNGYFTFTFKYTALRIHVLHTDRARFFLIRIIFLIYAHHPGS